MPSIITEIKVNATYLGATDKKEYYVAPGKYKQAIADTLEKHNLVSTADLCKQPGACAFCELNLETFNIRNPNSSLEKTIALFDKKIYRRTFNALPIGKQGTPCNIDWKSLQIACRPEYEEKSRQEHSRQECPTCGCQLPYTNFGSDEIKAKLKELSEFGLEDLLNPTSYSECPECGELMSNKKYDSPAPVTLNSCEDCLTVKNCGQLSESRESVLRYFKERNINCDVAFVEVLDEKHPKLLYDPAGVIDPVVEIITSTVEVKASKGIMPLSAPLQPRYELYNVRDIIRYNLCEKYNQYDLKPIGSGNGSIWINLPQNGRLFLASDAVLHYVLLYSQNLESYPGTSEGEMLPERVNRLEHDALPGFIRAHYPKKTTLDLLTENKISLLLTETRSVADWAERIPEEKFDALAAQGVKDASVLLDWYFNLLAKNNLIKTQQP